IFLTSKIPDAHIIPQRLGHQRKLGLMFTAHRNAGRVNLCEGWIGKKRAAFVSAVRGGDIGAARIGREIIDVPIPAAGEDDRVGRVSLDVSRSQAASDDSLGS